MQDENKSLVDRVAKGLGLEDAVELLRWVPKGYRDYRRPFESIRACEGRGRVAMTVMIRSRRDYDKNGVEVGGQQHQRPFRLSMEVIDSEGLTAWMTVFGNVFPWKGVTPGSTVTIYAETEWWNGKLQIKAPELLTQNLVGRMVALYRGKRGRVSEESVSAAIDELLKEGLDDAVAALEVEMGMREKDILSGARSIYPSLEAMLRALHRPADLKEAFRARDDARELTAFHLRNLARKMSERKPLAAARVAVSAERVERAIRGLPFSITADQRVAIDEIVADLVSTLPMRRLLSGDVGTGKTVTYLVPAIAAADAGALVAIVTPNTVLCQQLVEEVERFFPGTRTALVTGSNKKGAGHEGLLIGTTALINELRKAGRVPALLICDEQHRLGRAQRETLLGEQTNLLEATATAIPRTIAIATHGGMDVSILRECPVHKTVHTRVVTLKRRREVFAFLTNLVADGKKIAVIYPRYEEGHETKENVEEAAKHWELKFPGAVAMVHGRMSDKAKIEAIESVKTGEKRILIGTVVIENGVTIPQLTGLLVIASDSYGVSQLHQLRGRLVRDGGTGYMFLYLNRPTEGIAPETVERLRRVQSTTDGFELAEQDALARGFGDLSEDGDEQNGNMPWLFHGVTLRPADLIIH